MKHLDIAFHILRQAAAAGAVVASAMALPACAGSQAFNDYAASQVSYGEDARTGLCFAFSGEAMSNVPCAPLEDLRARDELRGMIGGAFRYGRDARTGLCFAMLGASMAHVPCAAAEGLMAETRAADASPPAR